MIASSCSECGRARRLAMLAITRASVIFGGASVLAFAACVDTSSPLVGGSRIRANSVQSEVTGSPTLHPDSVLAPGGYRPAGEVHRVRPGDVIRRVDSTQWQELDASGAVVATYVSTAPALQMPARPARPRIQPGLQDYYWITWAQWIRPDGQYITVDSSTWAVPPAPRSVDGQTVFLWNGLSLGDGVIQPVLQWGPAYGGGGSYWQVGCWWVSRNNTFVSNFVQVSPGTTLKGFVTGTYLGGLLRYRYTCDFWSGSTQLANLTVLGAPELQAAYRVLEAYNLQTCADYPASDSTRFSAVTVRTTAPITNPLPWETGRYFHECGQHTSVVDPTNPGGTIDVYYGPGVTVVGPHKLPDTYPTYYSYIWSAAANGATGSYTYSWSYYKSPSSTWYPSASSQADTLQWRGTSNPSAFYLIAVTVTSGSFPPFADTLEMVFDTTTATITGPGVVGPYVYSWSAPGVTQVDTTSSATDGFSYTTITQSPFTINLTITDSLGVQGSTSKSVSAAGYNCGS